MFENNNLLRSEDVWHLSHTVGLVCLRQCACVCLHCCHPSVHFTEGKVSFLAVLMKYNVIIFSLCVSIVKNMTVYEMSSQQLLRFILNSCSCYRALQICSLWLLLLLMNNILISYFLQNVWISIITYIMIAGARCIFSNCYCLGKNEDLLFQKTASAFALYYSISINDRFLKYYVKWTIEISPTVLSPT